MLKYNSSNRAKIDDEICRFGIYEKVFSNNEGRAKINFVF